MTQFTWVPFCEELGKAILKYRNRQIELIDILKKAGVQAGLSDKDAQGQEIPLTEIDPYTFMGMINKHKNLENRLQIISKVGISLNINVPSPTDFHGVPSANAQATWFFGYKNTRKDGDIPTIWELFEAQQNNAITQAVFQAVLNLKWIGDAKLTQALFWFQPRKYLPIDSQTKPFLRNAGIIPSPTDYSTYMELLKEVKDKFPGKEFYEISFEAWQSNQEPATEDDDIPEPEIDESNRRYWIFAPGEQARLFEDMRENSIIAMGWDDLGDLTRYEDKEAIRKALVKTYNYETAASNDARACYDFAFSLQAGDIIVAKEGVRKIVGFGVVKSDYRFDSTREEYKHVRDADWLNTDEYEISEGKQLPLKTLTRIYTDHEVVKRIQKIIGNDPTSVNLKTVKLKNEAAKYWWLNANPKHWNFMNMKIGETQVFTSHNSAGNQRQIQRYYSQVKPGDKVIGYVSSPLKEIVAECVVEKGLDETPEGSGITVRKTHTFYNPIGLHELQAEPMLDKCEPVCHNQGTLFSLTADEYYLIREMLDDRNDDSATDLEKPYSLQKCLQDLFIDEMHILDAVQLLRHKKNIVLQGPPGVGKTFVAKRLAYLLLNAESSERVETIQFHQSYSYEDFIQGIRPDKRGRFNTRDGVFCRFCKRAEIQKDKDFVFIIDEINRGNLSKIFGEAMMLLEADKRGHPVILANADDGETFTIPSNVYIIGTMNTADRSLAMVDYALRRRFCFFDVPPAFNMKESTEKVRQFLIKNKAEEAIIDKICSRISSLNEEIRNDSKDLGSGYEIGHSYFCSAPDGAFNETWYRRTIQFEIGPLLREYWFDNQEKAINAINALLA